jgi:hypothetical protein
MSANSKLTLTSLDFDGIKQNLKNFLKNQSQFQDFDFEGAGINVILDILAYNTHYNAFYMNMVANEMFLDTAVLRKSIVSHAKLLGYTPRSSTAAQASVNVAITKANSDTTTTLTLPRFSAFTSEPLDGTSYTFLSVEEQTVSNTGNQFLFNDVTIKEGLPVTKTYVVDNATNPQQYFDLSDPDIDTSTLEVMVQTSVTNLSQNTFTLAEDATDVEGSSNVYYIEEGDLGNYRIYFGDDIIGKKLSDGNIVVASYIKTNGEAANGLKIFRIQNALLSGATSNTQTYVNSAAGSSAEDASSVKFTAPKAYLSQNRAVTKNDYINLINKRYPYFDSVTVWGGEDNVPKVYGKVFISAKPRAGFAVTQAQKNFLIDEVLQPVGVLTVIPEFVDADYNYLNFKVNVFYDPTKTSVSSGQISSIVTNAVNNYANNNLNVFNNQFKISKLLRAIDDSETSITSSSADVFLEKRFDPDLDSTATYTLTFGTELKKGFGKEKLYSSPTFKQFDSVGIERDCFIEEVPESATGVESISVLDAGLGYINSPTLTIIGDGQGANAYAKIVNGRIESVVVDSEGSNYTTATVSISGGGGSGGSLETVIQGTLGRLRTYYFDNLNNKIVLTDQTGTINYKEGFIKLDNFATHNVANPTQTLSLHVQPADLNFSSNLNRILTFDTSDATALVTIVKTDI